MEHTTLFYIDISFGTVVQNSSKDFVHLHDLNHVRAALAGAQRLNSELTRQYNDIHCKSSWREFEFQKRLDSYTKEIDIVKLELSTSKVRFNLHFDCAL